jgi:hypothetical protein
MAHRELLRGHGLFAAGDCPWLVPGGGLVVDLLLPGRCRDIARTLWRTVAGCCPDIIQQRQRSLLVLPVVPARRDDRVRHSNFIRPVSPGQRDERRHGQTHFVFGAERSRDGALPAFCLFSR